jgi:hypothetical protein
MKSDGRRLVTRLLWLVGSLAGTVVAYLLLLGWNAKMSLAPEEPGSVGTECVGPYEPWQVIALGAVLAALVVAGTWFRRPFLVPAVSVVTLTMLFTLDASSVDDPCSDTTLLPLGVMLFFWASGAIAAFLVVVTHSVRNACAR